MGRLASLSHLLPKTMEKAKLFFKLLKNLREFERPKSSNISLVQEAEKCYQVIKKLVLELVTLDLTNYLIKQFFRKLELVGHMIA
ncbi:hypothetical protein CR513_43680, partial [Mucuna pruriens]